MFVVVMFCTVSMFVCVLESNVSATRMMNMFTTMTMVVVMCFVLWFLGAVNMGFCFMAMEVAAIRVVDMGFIYMTFYMFIPDMPTPWVMYIPMIGLMVVLAMVCLVPVIDMLFRFAVVQVPTTFRVYVVVYMLMGLPVFYVPATRAVHMLVMLVMVVVCLGMLLVVIMLALLMVAFMSMWLRVYSGGLVKMVFRVINKRVSMVVLASGGMDVSDFGLLVKLGLKLRHIYLLLLHAQMVFSR
jgi:hypothetical protein